jgi:hypothetical protein
MYTRDAAAVLLILHIQTPNGLMNQRLYTLSSF